MQRRTTRIIVAVAIATATGALTATFVSSGGRGTADAATELEQYVPIQDVQPNVRVASPGRRASVGKFTVDCGTNGNGKFSPDNPVAQPGIKNGAEHVHDFIGNLAITADSSNADLDASGTTCKKGGQVLVFLARRADRQNRPIRGRHPTRPRGDDADGDVSGRT